jgi:transcription elongation factor Elf1
MSKSHRGTGIRGEAHHGRGKCPRCGKENVKVLYEKEIDGNTVKVCKICNATLKNIARKEARAAKAAAPAAESSE